MHIPQSSGAVDHHRIPDARRALGERRAGVDLRAPAATGLGVKGDGDVQPMRIVVSALRRKLGDDADNPTYIFTEPRVGYRMPKGEGQEREMETPNTNNRPETVAN